MELGISFTSFIAVLAVGEGFKGKRPKTLKTSIKSGKKWGKLTFFGTNKKCLSSGIGGPNSKISKLKIKPFF